jgi:protein-tyrosine phosphatase
MRAIAIMGREVMRPRGLVGLGLDTLDASGREMAEVRFSVASTCVPLLH